MSDDGVAGDDSYTETEQAGWFSRASGAIGGAISGLALIALCAWGLFWNEGRAVTTTRSLAEASALTLEANAQQIDPANAGKLIHVTGDLRAKAPVFDKEFGVGAQAIRLDRVVEMFQWKQSVSSRSQSNLGGSQTNTTTYSYKLAWEPGRINSEQFKQPAGHVNPQPRFQQVNFFAKEPELGAFRPTARALHLLPTEALPVSAEAIEQLKSRYGDATRAEDGKIFFGADPAAPKLGDMRVSYKILPPGPVSIIGAQSGKDFALFKTQAGASLLLASRGAVSAEQMFRAAEKQNVLTTWLLRALGAFVMWLGFYALLRPFVVFADIIPLFGDVAAAGAALFAGVATLVAAPAAIAVAWFYYQPAASALIVIAGLAMAYVVRAGAGKAGQTPSLPPPRPLQGGAPLRVDAARGSGGR